MTSDKTEPNAVDEPIIENDPESELNKSTPNEPIFPEEPKPEWIDLLGSGSLMKKILKEGQPDTKPQRLEKCVINYELTLTDGTVVEKRELFELQLGDGDVVQGLDVAIGLMDVKERCILKIEPRLSYGTIGLPPQIPPNSKVIFDVELVSVTPEEDPEGLTILERKLKGNKKRERGNWWYGRGENTLAIQCYRRALDFLDEVEGGITYQPEKSEESTDNTLRDLLEDRISVCNNMAAAQIKMELFEAALNSLQIVLRCQPNNVKALFRKAIVHKAKNDLNDAMECLRKAAEVSPNNADVQKEMVAVNKLMQKQKVTERELARRMFSDSKPQTKEAQKKQSKSFLMLTATVAASFAIGLVGVAAYRLKYA